MPIKPRGKFKRSKTPKLAYALLGEPTIEIGAWSPDDQAKEPPEQVHLIIHLPGMEFPIVTRFKSPDTLGFIIEELARYRREVWPDAESVEVNDDR